MRDLIKMMFALVLALSLVACGGKSGGNTGNAGNAGNVQGVKVTLESLKKAASDAGYEVKAAYTNPEKSVGGFTVVFVDGSSDIQIPVIEFKDNTSAADYAKMLNDAGYQVALVNGKFLTMASANGKGVITHPAEKAFLENLINGRPLEKAVKQ